MAERLPDELLQLIIGYFDTSSYIEAHLRHDPAEVFDKEGHCPDARTDLKSISLVCRRWKRIARPLVFKHLHLHYEHWPQAENASTQPVDDIATFVVQNLGWLSGHVQSVTIFFYASDENSRTNLRVKRRVLSAANRHQTGSPSIEDVADLVLAGIDPCNATESSLSEPVVAYDPLKDIWPLIKEVSPLRFTVVGSGSLLARVFRGSFYHNPFDPSIWSGRLRFVSFSRGTRLPQEVNTTNQDFSTTPLNKLWNLLPWSQVLFNEGFGFGFDFDTTYPRKESFHHFMENLNQADRHVWFHPSSIESIVYVCPYGRPDLGWLFARVLGSSQALHRFEFQAFPPGFDVDQFVTESRYNEERKAQLRRHLTEMHPLEILFETIWGMLNSALFRETPAFQVYDCPDLARLPERWAQLVSRSEEWDGAEAFVLPQPSQPGRFIRLGSETYPGHGGS